MSSGTWTRLTTCRATGHIHVCLRFGSPARVCRLRSLTHYWFTPGQVFAVTWWARVSPRKQFACFAVVESLRVGDAGHRLPCIRPAVRVHLFVNTRCVGKDRRVVDRADALVRQINDAGLEPRRVSPAYFRAAGQSLRVRREPRQLHAEPMLHTGRSGSNEA